MATTPLLTIVELEQSPPSGEWELIDGELVPMPPSSFESSSLAVRIARLVGNYVDARGLGMITGADGGYILFADRDTVRVPDVAFVRRERLPPPAERSRFARLAPDLAVEVLSPSDRPSDVVAKMEMYQEAGIPLIWLVDPEQQTITVVASGQRTVVLKPGDILDGGQVLPGFSIPVITIFA